MYNYEDKVEVQTPGNHVFKGHPVIRNKVVVITEACVTDFTRDDRKLMIGKFRTGDDSHVVKVLPSDTGHSLELHGEMVLLEEEEPLAVVYAPDLGDELWCTFHGLVYEREG